MRQTFLLLILFSILFNCVKKDKTAKPIDYIPNNSELVLKTNNFEGLLTNLKNNHFANTINSTEYFELVQHKLKPLKHLNSENEIYISFFTSDSDSLEFTFATRFNDSLINKGTLKNFSVETLEFKSENIEKYFIENSTLYTFTQDSITVGSSDLSKLKELTNNDFEDNKIKTVLDTAADEASFSVFVNNRLFYKTLIPLDSIISSNFTNFMAR